MQQPGPSNWASDFQRLNISSPPPHLQQQSFNPQTQQRQDGSGWHQDFARQQGQMGERIAQTPVQPGPSYGYSPSPMSMMGMGMQSPFSGGFIGQQAENSQQQHQLAEAFDEEAFARAFDEAAQSELEELTQHQNQSDLELGQDILINESAERLLASEIPNQAPIGADTIQDPASQDPSSQDPDALSRTAAQLLDSVRHDQSEKFQNSQFLELMRQFRDKEATVEGDKIVSSGSIGLENKVVQPQ
jgi:hypothetical protein